MKTIGKRIRGRTISEYVTGILERQVPDHRVRVEPIEEPVRDSTNAD
jgi:hypothetical protein